MIEFFRENIIFFLSSVIMIGLVVSAPEFKGNQISNQQSIADVSSSSVSLENTIEPQTASSVISPPVNIEPTIQPKKSIPAKFPLTNTREERGFRDEESDD